MTATFTAVYRDGAFHPTSPPDLADGATVTLTLVGTPETTPSPASDPQEVYRQLLAISKLAVEDPDGATDVARNHDKYLYGGPGGAR